MTELPKWADKAIDCTIDDISDIDGDPSWTARYQAGLEAGIRLVLDRVRMTAENDPEPGPFGLYKRISDATTYAARRDLRKEVMGDE